MNKLFNTKHFLIVELSLLFLLIVGFLMFGFGLFEDYFGYCSSCPPGAVCTMLLAPPCSQLYGRIIIVVSGVIMFLYGFVFIAYRFSRK